jgi:hypothetical protein
VGKSQNIAKANAADFKRATSAATNASADAPRVPTLNEVMRNLYKRIHPDLLTNYPEQKHINEQSLMTLQGLLNALKDASGDTPYPKIINAILPFYLRGKTSGHFQKSELLLHTTGTACKAIVQKQLETFFKQTGLATSFTWDAEYFPAKTIPSERMSEEEADQHAAYESDSRGAYDETYEQFRARMEREASKQN